MTENKEIKLRKLLNGELTEGRKILDGKATGDASYLINDFEHFLSSLIFFIDDQRPEKETVHS